MTSANTHMSDPVSELLNSSTFCMKKRVSGIALVVASLLLVGGTAWAVPTPVPKVPDAGSSGLLLVLATFGLGVVRRFLRR